MSINKRLKFLLLSTALLGLAACGGGNPASEANNSVSGSTSSNKTVTEWTKVADEYNNFTLASTQLVRYGAGDKWVEQTLAAGTYPCGNDLFGSDPVKGTQKTCEAQVVATITWTKVADEYKEFTLTSTQIVRYGAGDKWVEKTLDAGKYLCGNELFGSDPVKGTQKACETQTTAMDTPSVTTKTVNFQAESEAFGNPERGLSPNHAFHTTEDNLNRKSLRSHIQAGCPEGDPAVKQCADDKTRLINYGVTLNAFRSVDDLASAASYTKLIDLLKSDFAAAREYGFKLVVNFRYWANGPDCAYDSECAAKNRLTDVEYSRMMKHIERLGNAVIRENADVIAYAKAGFIGAWGEWNKGTRGLGNDFYDLENNKFTFGTYDMTQNSRNIFEQVQKMVGDSRMVAQRYTSNTRRFYGESPINDQQCFDGSVKSRTAGHDDFLGESINSTDFIYLRSANRCTPYGGEGMPNSLSNFSSSQQLYDQLRDLHWSNIQPTSLNKSDWATTFSSILKNIGYRYTLKNAALPVEVASNGTLSARISLANEGFGNLYNKRPAYLVLVNSSTQEYKRFKALDDVRRVMPMAGENGKALNGNTSLNLAVKLDATLRPGNYTVYLALPDASDKITNKWQFAVRLAGLRANNTSVFNKDHGANYIGDVTIK
jgi:hypothetical protein